MMTREVAPKFHMSMVLLLLFFGLNVFHASIIQNNPEDLWHFVPDTWEESWYSIKMSYMAWNARLGELACYLVGDNFRTWILVLHPVCLTLAVVSLYHLATGEWPIYGQRVCTPLALIAISLWGLHSGISWFNGNCSWLYPCSFALFFFAMTERIFAGDFSMGWGRVLALLPIAVIIGMSNENTSLISLLFFGGAGVYWKLKRNAKWGAPYTVLTAVLLLAALTFYSAPARVARSEEAGWELTLSNILHNCVKASDWIYFAISFWRPFLILLLLLLWKPKLNNLLLTPRYLLVGLAFFMLWGVLVLTPCWGAPRAYCPMEMLLIVLMAALFRAKTMDSHWLTRAAFLVAQACIMATIVWPACQMDWSRYKVWCHIEGLAEQAKAEGQEVLVITKADVDAQAQPVSQIWKIPHSVYPYKDSIGYLAIPGPIDKPVDYFERTLPQWREAPLNRPLSIKLGLKELRWEKEPEAGKNR